MHDQDLVFFHALLLLPILWGEKGKKKKMALRFLPIECFCKLGLNFRVLHVFCFWGLWGIWDLQKGRRTPQNAYEEESSTLIQPASIAKNLAWVFTEQFLERKKGTVGFTVSMIDLLLLLRMLLWWRWWCCCLVICSNQMICFTSCFRAQNREFFIVGDGMDAGKQRMSSNNSRSASPIRMLQFRFLLLL
jgi:hypothetical protein